MTKRHLQQCFTDEPRSSKSAFIALSNEEAVLVEGCLSELVIQLTKDGKYSGTCLQSNKALLAKLRQFNK